MFFKKFLVPVLICSVIFAGMGHDIRSNEQTSKSVGVNNSEIDLLKSYGINLDTGKFDEIQKKIGEIVKNKECSDDKRRNSIVEMLKEYTGKDWNFYSKKIETVWLSSYVSEEYRFETDDGFLCLVVNYHDGSISLKSEINSDEKSNSNKKGKEWTLFRLHTINSQNKKWKVTTKDKIPQKSKIMENILSCAENSSSDNDRQNKILDVLKKEYDGSWNVENNFLGSLLYRYRLSETYNGKLDNGSAMSFTVTKQS